jgi:hypothetical protein
MDCLPVRERLTEYALSTLDRDERAFVERHLEWCAGCRKEAAELTSAAALAGEAVPQAEPPAELEDRIVRAVRAAAGTRPRRRRVRGVAVLAAATLVLLALGVGWGASVVQSARHKEQAAVSRADAIAERLDRLFRTLVPHHQGGHPTVGPRDQLRKAQLAPPSLGMHGGGSAALFISHVQDDWALVVVGGLSEKAAPYRVSLRNQYGQFAYVGAISKLDAGGGAAIWHEYQQHLNAYTDVIVKDRGGRIVLSGSVSPAPVATATP